MFSVKCLTTADTVPKQWHALLIVATTTLIPVGELTKEHQPNAGCNASAEVCLISHKMRQFGTGDSIVQLTPRLGAYYYAVPASVCLL